MVHFFQGNFLDEVNTFSEVFNMNIYQVEMHDGYWIRFADFHMKGKGNYAYK